MFEFLIEDLPRQQLEVERASISLFYHAATQDPEIALYVEVSAKPVEVPMPEDDYTHRIAPTFYTEWLDIPLSALKTQGLDALDGYQMIYDVTREEELGFDQVPGAVYQDSHGGFTRATMTLSYIEGTTYRVQAEGMTEFGFEFRIDVTADLTKVSFRHGGNYGSATKDPDVVADFDRLFDREQFNADWKQLGPASKPWFDYVATPKLNSEEN